MKRAHTMSKWERLDDLLRRLGNDEFSLDLFWRMMAQQNLTDQDIDDYCSGVLPAPTNCATAKPKRRT